ncbi:hypothetical protein KJ940_17275 [Myxococcota bacterium]|nr:hypothetical protein [Myxococcota bacterium]
MSQLLIAVGGSGQHSALAIARLMYLGALPPDIDCHVIDADTESPLSETLQSFDGYVDQKLGARHPMAPHFLPPFDSTGVGGDGLKFRNLLDEQPGDTAHLINALFTQEDADQDVAHGFFARPTLGASAFAAQQNHIAEEINAVANNKQRVMVCGSFIGGTGAGVIPSFVQRLGDAQRWFGAFHLGWLNPPINQAAAISKADMDSNMRHGLDYFYRTVRPHLKASALLGPPLNAQGFLEARTPVQGEVSSIYHLLAARALFQFATDMTTNFQSNVIAYSHDNAQPRSLLEMKWHENISLIKRLTVARHTIQLLSFYTEDETQQKNLKSSFSIWSNKSDIPPYLYDCIIMYSNAGGMKKKRNEFIDLLILSLKHRQEALNRCINWVNQCYDNGITWSQYDSDISGSHLDQLKLIWKLSSTKPPNQVKNPQDLANHLADVLINIITEHLTRN